MSTFDKIDNYLKDKKGSELSLVFFMLFAVIGVIVYLYVFPVTEKNIKNMKKTAANVDKKLNQEIAYMRSITVNGDKDYFIKKLNHEIKNEKLLLEKTTYENGYVDNKLKELSYLLFNDKNWAMFLDSIALVAKDNKINVKAIENQFTKLDLQKIDKVLNVAVTFSGTFTDIMNFINTLEESQLVVDIYDIELKSSDTIDGKLNIAVWGDEILKNIIKILSVSSLLCSALIANDTTSSDMAEYDGLFLEISDKRVGVEKKEIKKVKNPFVMKTLAKKVNGETEETIVKAEIVYTLHAIFGNKAKINNNWYKVNEKLGYYKLSQIKSKSVLLTSASDSKELFIRKHNANNVKFSSK